MYILDLIPMLNANHTILTVIDVAVVVVQWKVNLPREWNSIQFFFTDNIQLPIFKIIAIKTELISLHSCASGNKYHLIITSKVVE